MNDLDSWLMRGARADLSGAADAVVLAAAIAVAVFLVVGIAYGWF